MSVVLCVASALPAEDLPIYRLLFMANFTALHYGPRAKTPDYRCSNDYGAQYMWRLRGLAERLTSAATRTIDLPQCAGSGIQLTVTPLNYSSEYSRVRALLQGRVARVCLHVLAAASS